MIPQTFGQKDDWRKPPTRRRPPNLKLEAHHIEVGGAPLCRRPYVSERVLEATGTIVACSHDAAYGAGRDAKEIRRVFEKRGYVRVVKGACCCQVRT